MRRRIVVASVLLLAGCTALAPEPSDERVELPQVGAFSSAPPGATLPPGWRRWQVAGFKKPTEYRLVEQGGRAVVSAYAHGSASGLVYPVSVDLREHPYLHWHWMVPALIPSADNTRRQTEDSPVRVMVAFDGDKSQLPFEDRIRFDQFRMITRQELPYATLVYIWENRVPKETVIASAHTSRIQMIVVESGDANVGRWPEYLRDVREDYRRAFGEEPGPVRSVGIMTDSDNTGEEARGYYGDIRFLRQRPRAATPYVGAPVRR
ncbi:MAG: DUF3047 domain-containing protein [Burkholderiales bacterium]|nr:DUF3047 domain-containing protein [Burkholderiales bacterium]